MLVGLKELAVPNDGIRYSLNPGDVSRLNIPKGRVLIVNFSAQTPLDPAMTNAVDLMAKAKIMLNGHDRFAERPQTYFRLVQPYQHHTRIPGKHIYVYSFGIRPEEHQPSGTVNMSRIDNAQLKMELTNPSALPSVLSGTTGNIHIYAPNYNVFRVMSGMGGLAYSN